MPSISRSIEYQPKCAIVITPVPGRPNCSAIKGAAAASASQYRVDVIEAQRKRTTPTKAKPATTGAHDMSWRKCVGPCLSPTVVEIDAGLIDSSDFPLLVMLSR